MLFHLGWKLVHGDVFRTPQNCSLFCALIGIGVQFFVLCFLGLFLAVAELISPTLPGGSVYITAIILYSLTNAVSGFVSSGLYSQIGDGQWAWNIITTSTVFFVPFFLISVILNIIASIYHTTHALSPSTLVFLLSIYLFVGFPLTVVGGIAGRHMWPPYEPPCRTNHFVRAIPTPPFYRSAPMQYFVAGFLPFRFVEIGLASHYYYLTLLAVASILSFIIFLTLFGATIHTICTASCFWCSSSWSLSHHASPLLWLTFNCHWRITIGGGDLSSVEGLFCSLLCSPLCTFENLNLSIPYRRLIIPLQGNGSVHFFVFNFLLLLPQWNVWTPSGRQVIDESWRVLT